jgi:Tol biopolymer transport system component
MILPYLLVLMLLPLPAYGEIAFSSTPKSHPELRWQTLETEHFAIHFYSGEEEAARRLSTLAEEIHAVLTPELRWSPSGQTQIILTDSLDDVSGLATVFPYNTIFINQTPPLVTIPHDDWLRLVLTHEYTHILQLDAVHGFPALIRRVFGRLYFPNLFQPLFLVEGLATYEETRHTAGGRGRAPFTDMVLRTSLLENRFPSVDQAAGGLVTWPGGSVPYLYGVSFHQYLADRYGEEILGKLSESYSARWFPYLVGTNAWSVLGKRYPELWEEWKADLIGRVTPEVEKLRNEGVTEATYLTGEGFLNTAPSYSPDGQWLAYAVQNADSFPQLRVMRTDGTDNHPLTLSAGSPQASGLGLSWTPDGTGIVFAQRDFYRNYYLYNDLYHFGLTTHRLTRLTKGLRATDPAVSPDGKRIVFVLHRPGGRSDLAIFALSSDVLESGEPLTLNRQGVTEDRDSPVRLLTHTERPVIYSLPRWSPDGTRIAVGIWKDGRQGIQVLDTQGKTLLQIPREEMDVVPAKAGTQILDSPFRGNDVTSKSVSSWAPAWSPDGRYLIFSSDRKGIFNLYAYDLTHRKLYQVTRVLGGAFAPAVSPDGNQIAFSGYRASGFDIALMEFNTASWKEVWETPGSGTLEEPNGVEGPSFPFRLPLNPVAASPHPYTPWPTLLPRFWFPWPGVDETGGIPGFLTGGADALGKHQYLLTAFYGTKADRTAYSFLYQNDQFLPTIDFQLMDFALSYSSLDLGSRFRILNYWERQRRMGIDVIFPFRHVLSSQTLSFGLRHTRLSSLVTIPTGFPSPEEGVLSGVRGAWGFGNARRYGFSISPEDGRQVLLAHERMDQNLGSDFNLGKTVLDWKEHLPLPLKHHVLFVRGVAGIGTGDRLSQRAFRLGGPEVQETLSTLDDRYLFLRGYPSGRFVGQRVALGTLEYRFPLFNIERGRGTWPLFFQRLHGALFMEAGKTWDQGGLSLRDFNRGIGAEIRLDTDLGYYFPFTFKLGVARGLDHGGEKQFFLSLVLQGS